MSSKVQNNGEVLDTLIVVAAILTRERIFFHSGPRGMGLKCTPPPPPLKSHNFRISPLPYTLFVAAKTAHKNVFRYFDTSVTHGVVYASLPQSFITSDMRKIQIRYCTLRTAETGC